MRIYIEPGDFPATSGLSLTPGLLTDPLRGFSIQVQQRPGRKAFALFQFHGSGYLVEDVTVEVEGEGVRPEKPASSLPRNERGQFTKTVVRSQWEQAATEPALTGPRLQDTSFLED